MQRSEYVINKGVNAEVEFRGLRGQWLYYLGGGLAILLILFVIIYLCGIHTAICLGITFMCGIALFYWVYKANKTYGKDGMMKKQARRVMAGAINNYSRIIFFKRQ